MARTFRSVLAPKGINVDYIEITSQPTKMLYEVGDTLDITGLVVTAHADLMSGDVTSDCTITPQTLSTSGNQTITISYAGLSLTYTVQVKIHSISVTTHPTTTAYIVGDTLDLTGIVVTSNVYGDVTEDCVFSPVDGSTLSNSGTNTISISYTSHIGTVTTTDNVAVYAYSSIAFTSNPTKVQYDVNDTLDLTGVEITAYAGNLTRVVTEYCTFTPSDGTLLDTEGEFNLTATFENFTATTGYRVGEPLVIVSFDSGTDAQLKTMLQAHYNGVINIFDYWHVGDTRTAYLPAYTDGYLQRSFSGQNVTLVIMQANLDNAVSQTEKFKNAYSLVEPINGHVYPAFIVGQKNCLGNGTTLEGGYQNSGNTNKNGAYGSSLGTSVNDYYYNKVFSDDFRSMIKRVKYRYIKTDGSVGYMSRYINLPSEYGVLGVDTNSKNGDGAFVYTYYQTTANRKKYIATSTKTCNYWLRDKVSSNTTQFVCINTSGATAKANASVQYGIAPIFCI